MSCGDLADDRPSLKEWGNQAAYSPAVFQSTAAMGMRMSTTRCTHWRNVPEGRRESQQSLTPDQVA